MPVSEEESLLVENEKEEPIPGIDNPDSMVTDLDEPTTKEKPEESEAALEDEGKEKPAKEGVEAGEKSSKEPKPAKEPKPEKTVYTQEELEELLKSDAETVDTSRLTSEGRLLMKSFQRGFDQKFKGLSEQQKKLEQDKEAQANPKVQLFNRYVKDPVGVTKEINAEISVLEEIEPGNAEYGKARKTIAALNGLKDEFREVQNQNVRASQGAETLRAKSVSSILEDIPDFAEKEPKMTKYAQAELGLTMDDIVMMSDPLKVGLERAVRFVKAVNKAFDKANAGKTAERKLKIPAPLNRAGSGGDLEEDNSKSPSDMSYKDYRAMRMGKNKK